MNKGRMRLDQLAGKTEPFGRTWQLKAGVLDGSQSQNTVFSVTRLAHFTYSNELSSRFDWPVVVPLLIRMGEGHTFAPVDCCTWSRRWYTGETRGPKSRRSGWIKITLIITTTIIPWTIQEAPGVDAVQGNFYIHCLSWVLTTLGGW